MSVVKWAASQDVANVSDDEWRSWQRFAGCAELLYREINAALISRHGLSLVDVRLLMHLDADPHRFLRMGALASVLAVTPSRATFLVDRLEKRGFARRFRIRDDKRGVAVGISRHGRDYLRPVLGTYSRLVRQFYLAPLTRDQMIALGDCARRVGSAIKSGSTG
jgi:DNA-binding MarR family transcriptional regulator